MSGYLANQVWWYKLDKTTAHVLMALCDIANDDGTKCHPSMAYVAWKTGCSLATCYRIVEALSAKGAMEEVGTHGDVTEYSIYLDRLPLKESWERPRKGRPRKNAAPESLSQREKSSHGEKSFSQREKSSHGEKKTRTMRSVFSPRENESENKGAQTQAANGRKARRGASYPSLENKAYLTGLSELSGPTSQNEELQSAEPERTPPTPPLPPSPAPSAGDWRPAPALWQDVLAALGPSISPARRDTYFRPAQLLADADGAAYVVVATTAQAADLLRGYREAIAGELGTLTRRRGVAVDVQQRRKGSATR